MYTSSPSADVARRTDQIAAADARQRALGRACCDGCERWFDAEDLRELSTALDEGHFCERCAGKAMARARRAGRP